MILSAFSLEGKVAVVTGCDTGLGQGMALGLAQAGCDIVGINIVEPTETIEQVTALGRRFLSLTADLRKIDGIPALLDRAVAEFGHIDILVNNAGLIRREDALEFSEKDWDDVMNLNIKSVFFMSQAAAKHFIAQGNGGKIINIASMLSFQGGIDPALCRRIQINLVCSDTETANSDQFFCGVDHVFSQMGTGSQADEVGIADGFF